MGNRGEYEIAYYDFFHCTIKDKLIFVCSVKSKIVSTIKDNAKTCVKTLQCFFLKNPKVCFVLFILVIISERIANIIYVYIYIFIIVLLYLKKKIIPKDRWSQKQFKKI